VSLAFYVPCTLASGRVAEPHQQHQNPCERRYQTLKTMTNTLLDRSGSPACTWLLCLMHVAVLLNLMCNWTLGGIPLQCAEGSTQDISPILRFYWYEPVCYKEDHTPFPSTSREEPGHFVDVSRNVGHAMIYKILADGSNKVIHRSNLRSAVTNSDPNLRLDPLDGEILPPPSIVKSAQDDADDVSDDQVKTPMIYVDTGDLVGRTFLRKEGDDGLRSRVRIVEVLEDHERKTAENPLLMKFRCEVGDEAFEEVLSYNEVMNHIEKDVDSDDGENIVEVQTNFRTRRTVEQEPPVVER
jgi:hypothetical protein